MIILDDVIAVQHSITCTCGDHFKNMKDWLEHTEETAHIKHTHLVAIVGGSLRVGDEHTFEYVHSF